jgi:DNA-binding response OmpR family regulator
VLDLRLPDGRGEVVLTAISDGAARIPTVVITVEDASAVHSLAVDDYLTKPLDADRLNRWLTSVAARGLAGASLAR